MRELPPNPRLDYDSRVLTEIKFQDNPKKKRLTSVFRVKFLLKLVDRRDTFFYSYVNSSVEITDTSSYNINPNNEESSWKEVAWGLWYFLSLSNDTIQKVIKRVQTYIYWHRRPTWLVVSVNKVVVNQELLFFWYCMHGPALYLFPIIELSLKRITFEEYMNLKDKDEDNDDDEEYCCSICLENFGEEQEAGTGKVTCNMFSICLEYFSKQKDATLMCTPCNHVFHDHCILKWLRVSSNCPVCRRGGQRRVRDWL